MFHKNTWSTSCNRASWLKIHQVKQGRNLWILTPTENLCNNNMIIPTSLLSLDAVGIEVISGWNKWCLWNGLTQGLFNVAHISWRPRTVRHLQYMILMSSYKSYLSWYHQKFLLLDSILYLTHPTVDLLQSYLCPCSPQKRMHKSKTETTNNSSSKALTYPEHISTQEAKPVTFPNLQNSNAPWKSENAQMKRWGFTTFTS